MGKASSTKKVQRAARAGGGRKAARANRQSWLFPAVVSFVVVVGVLLVAVSRGSNTAASEPPTLTDHWHEAYGIYACSTYLPDLPERLNSGIHTHGDGLIHVEPTNSAETGEHATVGKFIKDFGGGFKVNADELRVPDAQTYETGKSKCAGKVGEVKVLRWDNASDTSPEDITGRDLNAVKVRNGGMIAFAFVPKGTDISKIPVPPSTKNLEDPNAAEGGGASTSPPASTPATDVPTTLAPPSTVPAAPPTSAP